MFISFQILMNVPAIRARIQECAMIKLPLMNVHVRVGTREKTVKLVSKIN